MTMLSEVDHAGEGFKHEEVRAEKADEINSSIIKENNELSSSGVCENSEDGPVDNPNTAMEPTVSKGNDSMVDGHDKADESGKKVAVSEKKVEGTSSPSSKVTKKIVRKRKNNAEESPLNNVSTPPKVMKKNLTAVKESPPSGLGNLDENKKIENNAKQESTVKTVTVGDLMGNEGDSKKDVEVGKKVDEAIKIVKIVKRKKIVGKEKEVSTNSESVPVISATVEASAATTREEKSIETNVTPVVEKVDTDAIKDGANEAEKDEVASNRKPELRMRKKKEAVGSKSLADNPSNADKPSSSAKEKGLVKEDSAEKLKKVDGMGLIFMCNAKTKKDCYRYNIFGLPESKKELVSKVYKGMRLFLFDVDLKLMYGIYKAASPGGYNIQPKAFDSKFPSQVRFTVLKDCLPLPEETFKAAIKENYYRRHKFNCQLSSEQVKKLCNLFQSTSGKSLWLTGADRDVSGRSPRRSLESNRRLPRHKVRVHARERYPSPPRVRYPSPTRRLQLSVVHQAPPPPVSPSYAYERPSDAYYRRDHRGLDVELRSVDPLVDYQDPYALYRDHALYPEPAFPSSLPSAYSARLRPPSPPPRYRY